MLDPVPIIKTDYRTEHICSHRNPCFNDIQNIDLKLHWTNFMGVINMFVFVLWNASETLSSIPTLDMNLVLSYYTGFDHGRWMTYAVQAMLNAADYLISHHILRVSFAFFLVCVHCKGTSVVWDFNSLTTFRKDYITIVLPMTML